MLVGKSFIDIKIVYDIIQEYGGMYFQGMLYTIAIALGSVIVGVMIAFLILPLRLSKVKLLKVIAGAYVEIIRGTPILVQIYIVYWGITPFFKHFIPDVTLLGFIDTARYIPGVITIGINCGAYISEILRAGINAVDKGQTEAARSLGMTQTQTMLHIVLPQAIKNILPALGNEFVTVIKESSILYIIGINELMKVAKDLALITYAPMESYLIAAAVYFTLCFPTSKLIAYFERRMGHGDKNE